MNSNSREIELKFATDPAGLAAALASKLLSRDGTEAPGRLLSSTYFDTPDRELQRRRMVLRIRRAGRGVPLMGLKWQPASFEGPFARGELEIRSPGVVPDLNLFSEPVAGELRRIIGDRPLEPQFESRVKRRTRLLTFGASQIEAAFDEGEIVAGDRRAPISELELELKSGDPADLYDFATRLTESLPLRLDVVSKAERAFLLADNAVPAPVKARSPEFSADCTLDEAISIVTASALRQFLANWASLHADAHPESVHQMRVALRRMRSALAMFNREIPCPEFEVFRAEAKRIATDLGAARECDAFDDLVKSGPAAYFADADLFGPLLALVGERRKVVFEEARRLIEAPETTQFAVRLQGFLTRRGWRNGLSGDELPRLTQSAKSFAAASLERLYKRVLKRGRNLLALPDEERHNVRIALKNMRYGAEFFGVLFTGSEGQRPFLRAVANLQDLLGAHNDAASAEGFLASLEAGDRPQTAVAGGIVLGWFGRGASVTDSQLGRAWKDFRRAPTFWR